MRSETDNRERLYVSGARPGSLPEADRHPGEGRAPWWKTPYGRWRLTAEREAMNRFPSFRLLQDLGRLVWLGPLRSALDPNGRYVIKVMYPETFPDLPPEVTIVEPQLPEGVPHLLSPGRPCLYQPAQGPRGGYDPARTTAATLVAWTALWIHAYETWRTTGRWPGRGA